MDFYCSKAWCSILVFMALAPVQRVLGASEAWFLELPQQHADFLVEAAYEKDEEAYAKILDRIPELIKKGTIKEIERFWRDDAGLVKGSKVLGQVIPRIDYPFQGATFKSGSDYSSSAQVGSIRWMLPKTPDGAPEFKAITLRKLSNWWMPTLRVTEEGRVRILLERDLEATVSRVDLAAKIELAAEAPDNIPVSIGWFVTNDGLVTGLHYHDTVFGKNRRSQGPRPYGFMFDLKRSGSSGSYKYSVSAEYVRIGRADKDETYQYYEKELPSMVSLNGAFKKTVITWDRSSGVGSNLDEGQHGKFSLKAFKEPLVPSVPKAEIEEPVVAGEDGWIDLLGQLTPEQVRKTGQGWVLKNGELFSPAGKEKAIPLPGNFAETSYQVRVKLRRLTKKKLFYLGIPVAQQMTGFGLDGMGGNYTALVTVNHKSAKNSPGAVAGTQVIDSEPHVLDLTVRLAPDTDTVTVVAELDEKPLYKWSGKPSALKQRKVWATTQQGGLSLGSVGADWAVSAVSIRRLEE